MTSLYLLLWIVGGILLQLAIYLSIGFWRHWLDYLTLRNRASELGLPTQANAVPKAAEATVAAWSGWRTFRVSRKHLEDTAQDICSFELVPEDGQPLPPFLPGQFLTFRLDIPNASGGTDPVTRCYSLSDAPHASHYRVSIKRAPAPANSQATPGRGSHFFHDQVAVGNHLQVRAPSGHFHIDRSEAPVVLIGGGIGITPMLSMLNWCLAEQTGREVWLFYGVRHSAEQVMKTHLETLAAAHPHFHLHVCFSKPQANEVAGQDFQHAGRIDVDLLRRQLPLKPYHFYICGPTPLLQSLVPALEDWGVPEARIHFEAFGPASIPRKSKAAATLTPTTSAAAEAAIVVTFASSGKSVPWLPTTGSLLDLAEAHGIAVNSGCRAGGCGSCQTTIRSGEVAYRQLPEFDPEPGTCLLCVCTPKTSVTLEI